MRIEDSAYVVDLSRTEAANENEAGSSAQRGRQAGVESFDRVDISSCGRSLEDLRSQLDALPDVRLDRVALARQTLQDGGYNVQPALLAQKVARVPIIFS